jgi:ribonucleoside-triphosphate reductase (thioredoxin)
MNELPTLYQQSITKTKYSRWREDLGRRETWEETVTRLMDYFSDHLIRKHDPLDPNEYDELYNAILSLDVSPSMRAMMTAGPALERDHVAAYNCSFLALNRIQAFPEILYILCCGTGVGFSVERVHTEKLPVVPAGLREDKDALNTIIVPDSKEGWAESYGKLLRLLWSGTIPHIDYSLIRPAGMPLKTFGGRASGPEPLRDLFEYTILVFQRAAGRRLTPAEVHGLVTKIGDIVVVGGVRRSALISLFDQDDDEMLNLKSGEWWKDNPHYALANNSVAWTAAPNPDEFWAKWQALVDSNAGEPGIFNRKAAQEKLKRIGRDWKHFFGTNPCGEIILRDRQFCNLTEVTVRSGDDLESLKRKVRLAVILGVIQSTFTDFRFLSDEWKKNCEEERLLGVSFTGVMDNSLMSGRQGRAELRQTLRALRAYAREVADQWADRFGIARPAAIGCGKPSGNNSQRLDTASGIHQRFAPLYVRRTRMNKTDPVAQLLAFMGVPHEDEINHPDTTWVFSWPIKAPEEAVFGLSAVDMCEIVDDYNEYWCDHNQSVTINVKPEEWELVGSWVHLHFDRVVGMTFLPESDHVYQQAPYEPIGWYQYLELMDEMPDSIDWSLLTEFEHQDNTEGAKDLACVSGACEIA